MATNNRSIESLSVKPSPVALGKIPKLNLANRPKSMEKPTSSKSLTDQKFDTLVSNFTVTSNKNSKMSEKSLTNRLKSPPKHRSPQRSQRLQQNPIETSGSFAPTSPIVPDDSINNSLQKQPSVSYHTHASLPDTNTRLSSNFSHQDSITLENTQSQSPLSPVKYFRKKTPVSFFKILFNTTLGSFVNTLSSTIATIRATFPTNTSVSQNIYRFPY